MELTGKCKKSFTEWYLQVHKGNSPRLAEFVREAEMYNWEKKHPSEKYGVLVDFFDSVDIYLNAIAFERMRYFKAIVDGRMEKRKFKNRNDALTFAIKKANEIFNNRQ